MSVRHSCAAESKSWSSRPSWHLFKSPAYAFGNTPGSSVIKSGASAMFWACLPRFCGFSTWQTPVSAKRRLLSLCSQAAVAFGRLIKVTFYEGASRVLWQARASERACVRNDKDTGGGGVIMESLAGRAREWRAKAPTPHRWRLLVCVRARPTHWLQSWSSSKIINWAGYFSSLLKIVLNSC